MKFDDRTIDHLQGRSFSNALELAIGDRGSNPDRVSFLVDLCRGKRVIDLGFADHLELIDSKSHDATWLHGELSAVAQRCLGVDISEAGVERARKLGFDDVLRVDITLDPISMLESDTWDLLVLGEVLEHVDDPVAFLSAARARYGSQVGRLVITVPNAFSARNVLGAMRGREIVNSDHRFWFTPYTLAKVVTEAGWLPEWFRYCESFPRHASSSPLHRIRQLASTTVKSFAPALRPDLIMGATLAP
jgi:SAM-dependent methyltransferase